MREEQSKSGESATVASVTIDAKDAQILAVKADNPNASQRFIARKTGIPKSTVGDRLKAIEESDLVQQARQGLIDLLPAAVGIYRDVVTPPKDKFGIDKSVDTRLRVDVAGNILRGTGAHVEKSKQERSELPATAEGLFDALRSLSTYELNRFLALWEGRDPDGAGASDVVDGAEPSPDAPGTGVELQAQPVPDGDLPRPGA